jgi:VIT1/CCC1 family predicted Fe2+/Mn2+ transporter
MNIDFMKSSVSLSDKAEYLKDAVFAANDGIITTFAVVAGSTGASFSSNIVLILGFANLFADGFSMASGNYLGTKSEIEYEKVNGQNDHTHGTPAKVALVTFIAFISAGILPLLPYVLNLQKSFFLSTAIVVLSLFAVGASRGKFIKKNLFASGIEMLSVGGFAAVVAFVTGEVLKMIVK